MRPSSLAALISGLAGAAALAGCATDGVGASTAALRAQQSPMPVNQAAAWGTQDRLYRSLVLDYVDGARDTAAFRARMNSALDRAALRAPAPAAARYAVQVIFHRVKGGGESLATYRVMERASSTILFERDVVATAGGWMSPITYRDTVPGARDGGPRSGGKDLRDDESIARFVLMLGEAERVNFAALVPCLDNAEVLARKGALTARGVPWRTDDCRAYQQNRVDDGLRFTAFR